MIEIEVKVPVWQAEDNDSWYWAELPEELTEVVDRFTGGPSGGWASVKVQATVGHTTWNTSLFLSDGDTYLLPVKKPVRTAEHIEAGDEIDLVLLF